MTKHEIYMQKALQQARYAQLDDEVPIGAIIVYKDRVITQAYNQVERLKDPTAHAEILAITQAASYLKTKWLKGCTLYVTIEPCLMCAGALVLSRIDQVIFGALDIKAGAFGSKVDVNILSLNHKIRVRKNILASECTEAIQQFFKNKRIKAN
jgi:tRNA(adenine34) deaminase